MALLFANDTGSGTRKALAFSGGRIGALGESNLTHDPGLVWNTRLVSTLFDALSTREPRVHDLDSGRAVVVESVDEALKLDVPPAHGQPYLTFTVIIERDGAWFVYSVGANVVLHLSHAGSKLAVAPHSQLGRSGAPGSQNAPGHDAAALVETLVAGRGGEWKADIRSAPVVSGRGECLLAAPPSVAAYGRESFGPAHDRAAIEQVIEELAKPYAQYRRTWVAAIA